MSANLRLSAIWTRLRQEVIQDVPPSLEACESCRETDCVTERWMTCAKRLAGEAERMDELGLAVGATASRGEMPGGSSHEIPAAAAGDERRAAADSPRSASSS